MKEKLIVALYTISAFAEDFAYYVLGNGKYRKDISVKTPWRIHDFCD